MRKTAIRSAAALTAVATLFASSSAFALKTPAGMGTEGSLTVSADRLFGFLISSTYEEETVANVKRERTTRGTGLLIGTGSAGGAGPRVGLDYTVIPNLTIGAGIGLGYSTSSVKSTAGGTETTVDGPGVTTLFIAPRVGYLIDFSDNLGIWPRGGVTIARSSATSPGQSQTQGGVTVTTQETETTATNIWVTIDAPLVIAPSDHFAFTAGPFLDFPVSSSVSNKSGGTTVELDPAPKTTYVGLGIGMLGSF